MTIQLSVKDDIHFCISFSSIFGGPGELNSGRPTAKILKNEPICSIVGAK